MKKKIMISLLAITIISIFLIYFYMDIKSHFHSIVQTTSKVNLYDKNKKKIGNLYKNTEIELDRKSKSLWYFKIKNYPYYIYYRDIKRSTKKISTESNHSLGLNQNMKTNQNTTFLNLDNKKIVTMNDSITLPINYKDNDYYYVNYLNKELKVKKSDVSLQKKEEEKKEEEASYISIIHYEDISNSCDKEDCIDLSMIQEQLSLLEKLGYYTISFDEYDKYLNHNLRLPKKAVLLTTTKNNQYVDEVNNNSNYKIEVINNEKYQFLDINMKSTKESKKESIERYVVHRSTSLEEFQKMLEGKSIVSNPTNEIPVLNYHFFYDEEKKEECNESICLDVGDFKEQLNYLKENNYKTVTMEEFKRWMYQELELPEKSVLITVDDGALGTGIHNGNKLIPILEEYKMHATLFLIAGWWDINNYRSKYLDIESHTFNMHQYGSCGLGEVLCEEKEAVINDLKKSIEVIGSSKAFCFPFYNYDEKSIEAVQEVGFSLAFIGGFQKAKRTNDKYKIPRYPIYKTTSLNQFIHIIE